MRPSVLAATLIALTALWFVGMNGLHFFYLIPMSGGFTAPDLTPFYGYEHLKTWLNAMDEEARSEFLRWHTGFADLVFPFLLATTLVLLLYETFQFFPRFARQHGVLRWATVLLLVLPYLLFDVLENRLIGDIVRGDTLLDMATATTASAYTHLKFASASLALFIFIGICFTRLREARGRTSRGD